MDKVDRNKKRSGRHKWRMQNEPEYAEKVREYARLYAIRRRQDPATKATETKAQAQYRAKKRKDPAWLAKKNEETKEWQRQNADKVNTKNAQWRSNNPEKSKAYNKKAKEKILSTPKGKLDAAISHSVRQSISSGTKRGRRTFDLLGYTLEDLVKRIESQFSPGMSWANHGEWHIDHKIPLSAHNYQTPDDIDFKKAWALSNLQPLWARDNLSKGPRLNAPFQPSLALAVNDNKPREIAA